MAEERVAITEGSRSVFADGMDEPGYLRGNTLAERMIINNRERVKYAKMTFILTSFWIAIVLCIVYLSGRNYLNLSDTVIVTLITTTTVNVFGFFFLVMKYLFRVDQQEE